MTHWKKQYFPFLGLLVVTVLVFRNSWGNPFIFDDLLKIVGNPDIRDLSKLWKTLIYPYFSHLNNYRNDPSRPLIYLCYGLIYHFWKTNPVPYHLLNTGVHFLSGCLVFQITGKLFQSYSKRLRVTLSLVSAGLFLFLPIQAGTVIYIYGLSDLLSSLFVLSAVYLSMEGGAELPWRTVCAILGFYGLALLSKQSSIVLPFLLVLSDAVFLRPESSHFNLPGILSGLRKRKSLYILLPLMSALYILARLAFFGSVGDVELLEEPTFSHLEYLSTQGIVILRYLYLTIFPFGLTIDHALMPQSYSIGARMIAGIIVISIVLMSFTGLFRSKFRLVRLMGFGFLFFWVSLIPTSSVFLTSDCMVERRTYMGNFGLVLFLMAFVLWVLKVTNRASVLSKGTKLLHHLSVGIFGTLLLVLASLYAGRVIRRNELFSLDKNIWIESVIQYPNNLRAWNNVGLGYLAEKNLDRARAIFEFILKYDSNNYNASINLASVLESENNPGASLALNQKIVANYPNDYLSRFKSGILLVRLGRLQEARSYLESSLRLNPNFLETYLVLSQIEFSEGNRTKGLLYMDQAKALAF